MSTFHHHIRLDLNTAVSTSPGCGDESRPQVSAIRTSVRNAINPPRCREQNQHRPQNGVLPCKVGREGCLSVCFTWGCRVPQRLDRLRRGLLSSFLSNSLRKIPVCMLHLEMPSTSAISLPPQDMPSPTSTIPSTNLRVRSNWIISEGDY